MEAVFKDEIVDNTDRHFTGQQKNEGILLTTRLHPIILLPHALGFSLIAILMPMVVYGMSAIEVESATYLVQTVFFVLFAGYTYYAHKFFNRLLNYYLNVVILTNYRVIMVQRTIFLCDNKDTIDLHKIQDLKKGQDGLFCTLLNYGKVTIEVSAIHETKVLSYLPNPDKWFEILNRAKRRYIDERRTPRKSESVKGAGITMQRNILHHQVTRML